MEVLLAALITLLVFLVLRLKTVHDTLCQNKSDLVVLLLALVGMAVAVWVGFLTVLATDFGRWLRQRGQALWYTSALAAPIFIFLLTLLVTMFGGCAESAYKLMMEMFLLVYSAINVVTMVRNVIGLIDVWQLREQQNVRSERKE